MDLAIQKINGYAAKGKDVVANYVLRERDYKRLEREVIANPQIIITLAPKLEVAQSRRGGRELTEWEIARVKHHYDTGIASPNFGHVIDNSELTVEQTVVQILRIVAKYVH